MLYVQREKHPPSFWVIVGVSVCLCLSVYLSVCLCVCNLSPPCLSASKAGGRDSDREGQMETKTTVSHVCRNTGNPSSPSPVLFYHLSFSFPSCSHLAFPILSFPSCRLLSVLLFLSHPQGATVSTSQVFLCMFSSIPLLNISIQVCDDHSRS